MPGILKSKNSHDRQARAVYAGILEHIRKPEFYTMYAVPDTFDGRFDLMLVHVFLAIDGATRGAGTQAQAFNQALFDTVFADMDQTLREMGIGDMGIPKHMRRMMKAFNGRMHAYDAGLREGALKEALSRNLYGTLRNPPPCEVENMALYMQDSVSRLQKQGAEAIMCGAVSFPDPARQDKEA